MSMSRGPTAAKEEGKSLTWQPACRIRALIGQKKVTPTEVVATLL
jgi:hypothetical protein